MLPWPSRTYGAALTSHQKIIIDCNTQNEWFAQNFLLYATLHIMAITLILTVILLWNFVKQASINKFMTMKFSFPTTLKSQNKCYKRRRKIFSKQTLIELNLFKWMNLTWCLSFSEFLWYWRLSLHTMLSLRLVAILSVLFSLGGARPGKHYLIETEDRATVHRKQRHGGSKDKQVSRCPKKEGSFSNGHKFSKIHQNLKYWGCFGKPEF